MANSLPQVQFQATNTLNGSPDQTSFVQELHAALQGGTAVYDFFSGDMSALNDVVQQITTNGDSAWQLASQGSSLRIRLPRSQCSGALCNRAVKAPC